MRVRQGAYHGIAWPLGATPKNKRAHVERLEQKVACLEAKVAGFKEISERRERYLVAAVAAVILLLGVTFVVNREPIKKVATRWIPLLSHSNRDIAAAYDAYENKKYRFALRVARPTADRGDPARNPSWGSCTTTAAAWSATNAKR